MDLMHAEMNEDDKWMQSTMAWMQFLSGQTVDDFDFSEWAMVRILQNLARSKKSKNKK